MCQFSFKKLSKIIVVINLFKLIRHVAIVIYRQLKMSYCVIVDAMFQSPATRRHLSNTNGVFWLWCPHSAWTRNSLRLLENVFAWNVCIRYYYCTCCEVEVVCYAALGFGSSAFFFFGLSLITNGIHAVVFLTIAVGLGGIAISGWPRVANFLLFLVVFAFLSPPSCVPASFLLLLYTKRIIFEPWCLVRNLDVMW